MNGINNFKIQEMSVTPTLDTNVTTAGDVLCATVALEPSKKGQVFEGEVVGVRVLDKDDIGAELDVVLLNAETDLGTPGAQVTISDSDAENILTVINVGTADYADLVNSQIAEVECARVVKFQQTLYLGLIDRSGSNTFTASGLKVKVLLRADNPR